MPKDQRLYMTFPNDFHRHPKVSRLSDAEFRAFVEMNGEARIADNDGVFLAEEAAFLWPQPVIDALTKSHPTRPLVLCEGGNYVIRDYAQHQQTREERARLAEKNRLNGSKGGRPRKNPDETQWVTSGNPTEPNETQAKAEIETELEKEVSPSSEGERAPRKRGTRLSPDWLPAASLIASARTFAPDIDHRAEHAVFIDYWIAQPGQKGVKADWEATWRNWMRRKQGDLAGKTSQTAAQKNLSVVAMFEQQQQMEVEQ